MHLDLPASGAVRHAAPFSRPVVTWDEGVTAPTLSALRACFDAPRAWVHHRSFYECLLDEITDEVSPGLKAQARAVMEQLTGLPLADAVMVTAQRMEPGYLARVHTDLPRPGFECVRLVVQVGHGWRPGDGGELGFHARADDTEPALVRPPRAGTATGFVLTGEAHHGIAPVGRRRDAVLFHLWHRANPPELGSAVEALTTDVRFADLPTELGPVARDAETRLDADLTYRAGLVAHVLARWGAEPAEVVEGYRRAVGWSACPVWSGRGDASPRDVTLALARWVVALHEDGFVLERWEQVAPGWSAVPSHLPAAEAARALVLA